MLGLACLLAARPSFAWRMIAIQFGPILAAGFFAAVLLSDLAVNQVDVAAAMLFEFIILCMLCRLVFRAYQSLHEIPADRARILMHLCALLYLALFLPPALGSGFGILSEGTRIDYLYDNRLAKYLTYAGLMVATVLGGLVARRITLSGKLGLSEVVIVLVVSGTSILAGSKGGFLLWALAIVGYIDFQVARIRASTIVLALTGATLLVTVLALVVSDFLGITVPEFFDLALSRFFLNNDARALALELRGVRVEPGLDVLNEAFRSLSSLLGAPPRNDPLGVELYDRYFGPMGGAGANASLSAMLIYYTDPGEAPLPFLLAALFAALAFLVAIAGCKAMPGPATQFAMLVISALVMAMLSQDFLAFQVVAPLAVVIAVLFIVSGSLHAIVIRRPTRAGT